MLVAELISKCVAERYHNFELLVRCVSERAQTLGVSPSRSEIRLVLERMIARQEISAYQYLAEDNRYDPIIYNQQSIHYYWFGPQKRKPDYAKSNRGTQQ